MIARSSDLVHPAMGATVDQLLTRVRTTTTTYITNLRPPHLYLLPVSSQSTFDEKNDAA